MRIDKAQFERDGFLRVANQVACDEQENLEGLFSTDRAGTRLFSSPSPISTCSALTLAQEFLGADARPVRIILFDKSSDLNWSLGWHQDRTIAVAERCEAPGFGPWSSKAGVHHVEPPFELIEKMVTLRLHIDPSNDENGPLEVVPGSHKLGKLTDQQTLDVAAQSERRALFAEPGDVIALKTSIVHRSGPSKTERRRRIIHIDYSSEDLPSPLRWAFDEAQP